MLYQNAQAKHSRAAARLFHFVRDFVPKPRDNQMPHAILNPGTSRKYNLFFQKFIHFIRNKLNACSNYNLDIMFSNDINAWNIRCFNFILIHFLHILNLYSKTSCTVVNCCDIVITAKAFVNLLAHHCNFIFALIRAFFFLFFTCWFLFSTRCFQVKFHNEVTEQEIVNNCKYQTLYKQHVWLTRKWVEETQCKVYKPCTKAESRYPFEKCCNKH